MPDRNIECPICHNSANIKGVEECLSQHFREEKSSGYIKIGDRVEALDVDYYEHDEGTTEQAIYRRHFMISSGVVIEITGQYERKFSIRGNDGEITIVGWNEFYDDIPYSYMRWTALDAEPKVKFSPDRLRIRRSGLQIANNLNV